MNRIWQGITQTQAFDAPSLVNGILAQTQPVVPAPIAAPVTGFLESVGLGVIVGPFVLNLIAAIAILVIGWIVAAIAASLIKGLLERTDLDNRFASWITGRSSAADSPPIEKWVSSAVFWLIMILVLVAFLEKLQLTVVSQPLNNFLNQILGFLPKLGSAALLLAVAWVLATVTKLVVTRGLQAFRLDDRLRASTGSSEQESPFLLSQTLANALYWFIFLLFLPLVLDALQLQQALGPVNNLLNQILGALPNILNAVLIGVTGWLLAQVVRRIVTNLLAATGTDRLGSRFGISRTTGGQSLSWLIGTVVYVLILIPTAIAALDALKIETIAAPARSMLTQILNAIPQILTAALILAIAYFIGKFLGDLVTSILTSIGFNNIFYWLGLQSRPFVATRVDTDIPLSGEPTVLQTSPRTTRTPSELAGIVVLVGIMLVATVAATDVLKITALTAIVTALVAVSGRILAGLVVFAVGLYLANLAFNLITSSNTRQSRMLGQTARISIIVLVSAMALQQMGIASDIINLAFGLLLGAIAVAIALAFGLGSRDIAAHEVREWLASFKEKPPQ